MTFRIQDNQYPLGVISRVEVPCIQFQLTYDPTLSLINWAQLHWENLRLSDERHFLYGMKNRTFRSLIWFAYHCIFNDDYTTQWWTDNYKVRINVENENRCNEDDTLRGKTEQRQEICAKTRVQQAINFKLNRTGRNFKWLKNRLTLIWESTVLQMSNKDNRCVQ